MERSNLKGFVFDLDGTLLDTLPDLVVLTNETLSRHGYPTHSTEAICGFVGKGAAMLIRRALPAECSDAEVDAVVATWRELFPSLGHANTKPYKGVPELLHELKGRGCRLAVLSNKFDAGTREVIAAHFPGVFDEVHGECADYPRKPDPTGLEKTIVQLGCDPSEVGYVGDSGTDMEVAVRAHAAPLGVSWGYQSRATLIEGGARVIVDHPRDLLVWAQN